MSAEKILRLYGMINYLSRFLLNLSEVKKLLCDLTHKKTVWFWLATHEKAWNEVKHLIVTALVLAYYKLSESLQIQCDSSQTGLGVALMQKGHPIAYASRQDSLKQKHDMPRLSETETR